MQLTFL